MLAAFAAIASWLTLAGQAASRAPLAAGCPGSSLRGSFVEVLGSRAMGHAEYVLSLRNTSQQACMLKAHPKLELLDDSGHLLPTDASWAGGSASASAPTLGPRQSASAVALVAVDIPRAGDVQRPGAPCQPTATGLRVGEAGASSTLVPTQPATAVCERGSLSLQAFVLRIPAPAIPSGIRTMVERLLRYPPSDYTLRARFDPHDSSWVEWSYAPAGPADRMQGGVGFAHLANGTWRNLWGPGNVAFCRLAGAPAIVPATVLRALGVSCAAR